VNEGVVFALTTTFIVEVVAHCPVVGVNVYVVVPSLAVVIAEGLHVPVIPFAEVVAKFAGVASTQYGPSAANEGAISVATTMSVE